MQVCCVLKYYVASFGSGDTGVRLQNSPARILFPIVRLWLQTQSIRKLLFECCRSRWRSLLATANSWVLLTMPFIQNLGPYQVLPLRIKPLALTLWQCSRHLLVCLACMFASLVIYRLYQFTSIPSIFLSFPLSLLSNPCLSECVQVSWWEIVFFFNLCKDVLRLFNYVKICCSFTLPA